MPRSQGPLGRLLGVALVAAAVAAAIGVLASTLCFLIESYWTGPVGSSWLFLLDLRRSLRAGDAWPLFRSYGGHTLIVPKLLYWVEYSVFAGTNAFLIGCSIVLQALTASLLGRAILGSRDTLPDFRAPFLMALLPIALFTATQLENFARSWNVHHFLCFTAATAAFSCLIRVARARSGLRAGAWLALGLAAAGVSSDAMSNGLLVWPILLLLGARLRLGRARLLAIALAGLCLGAIVLGALFASIHAPAAESLLWGPRRLAVGIAAQLGAPLSWQMPGAGAALGGLAAAAALLLALRVLWSPDPSELEVLCVGLVLLSIGTATLIALGRAEHLEYWRAARYQTGVMLFWWSFFALALSWAERPRRGLLVAASVGIWVAGVLVPAHMREGDRVRSFAEQVRAANAALLVGVEDRRAYLSVLPAYAVKGWLHDSVQQLRSFVREQRLEPFASGDDALLGRVIGVDLRVAADETCGGRMEAAWPLSAPSRSFRLSGRVSRQGVRGGTRILIADARGRVIGLGARTERRLGIRPGPPGERDGSAWVAFTRPLAGPVVASAWVVVGKDSVCRFGGRVPLPPKAGQAPRAVGWAEVGYIPGRWG